MNIKFFILSLVISFFFTDIYSKNHVEKSLKKDFDFSKDESYESDAEKRDFVSNEKELLKQLDTDVNLFSRKLGSLCYGMGNVNLEEVVGELLRENKLTVSTAESCTGGKLASKITSVPGSSDYFPGSIITYSNEAKEKQLGVPGKLLEEYGAVSQQVVESMAESVRIKFNSDYGLATSGIAGPDGGSEEKPVGTIWVAISSKNGIKSEKLNLGYSRVVNMAMTSDYLLNKLRKELLRIV